MALNLMLLPEPARRRLVQGWRHMRPVLPDRFMPFNTELGVLYLNPSESRSMFAAGVGLTNEPMLEILRDRTKPGALVLDIGASVGGYTLAAATATGPDGLVIAFEPEPHNSRLIQQVLVANGVSNVRQLCLALGSEDGLLPLQISGDTGHHSLVHDSGRPEGARPTIEVAVRRLDGLLDELNIDPADYPQVVIKLDVEGFEEGVLEGASATLAALTEAIVILELHPDRGVDNAAVGRKLGAAGFHITSADESETWTTIPQTATRVVATKP